MWALGRHCLLPHSLSYFHKKGERDLFGRSDPPLGHALSFPLSHLFLLPCLSANVPGARKKRRKKDGLTDHTIHYTTLQCPSYPPRLFAILSGGYREVLAMLEHFHFMSNIGLITTIFLSLQHRLTSAWTISKMSRTTLQHCRQYQPLPLPRPVPRWTCCRRPSGWGRCCWRCSSSHSCSRSCTTCTRRGRRPGRRGRTQRTRRAGGSNKYADKNIS